MGGVEIRETTTDWRSYDSVAESYAQVRAARNALLARDLVALVVPPFRGRVLDVGAGTGVAAQAALVATGSDGTVVAVDPSLGMLRRVDSRGRIPVAAAAAPGLPFAGGRFDAVLANLVLADVSDYRPALGEMTGVLRPGGRLGATVWGSLGDGPPVDDHDERAAYDLWRRLATELVDAAALDDAADEAIPWAAWFADPARLRAALEAAGLSRVELVGRAYRYQLSHADWLTGVHTSAQARYLRGTVDDAKWEAFTTRVLGAARRLGPGVAPLRRRGAPRRRHVARSPPRPGRVGASTDRRVLTPPHGTSVDSPPWTP